ncbi:hypothetical protein EMIHUDRAFT_215169 [Emiliania huxleyi CCMP1516]|uniref:Tc1-like transposase DDE domain-containing protein n=2 Tax=Emiliania huxleyi TaxID=2903 RepID=A0A0D3II11_EMIH1|nr:hypothetical protein EMIHUDRAFT_215169 [Emiliania huxleyi CCMP1516]EOD10896.1 hypothetical protein EMIHUDRAFT_215169 [Emiliania huxleyi CCMP1516]|eukprot:XP_005763325.1 hypothetical protein EMIHUDRAFT_215169 [Emiliania huxleyi CCMP1516]
MFAVLALLSLAGVLAAGLALASARRSPARASRRTQSLLPLLHPSDAPLGSPPLDSPPPSPTGFGPLGSSSALSDDLRWRIVYKRLVFDMTFAEIADDLLVSESSACEIWRRFETPPHDISSHQGERLSPAIVPPELHPQLLDCLTQCNMEDSLSDICSAFYNVTGIRMSIPTMCQTLKRMGMTRKRARYPSPPHQRAYDARKAQDFVTHILNNYNLEQLIWIDESAVDKRLLNKRYGYALRGLRADSSRGILARGKRHSMLGFFDVNVGHVGHVTVEGGFDSEAFASACTDHLMPVMSKFTQCFGMEQRSVVIMDNCGIHRNQQLLNLFHSRGFVVEFLPPYSPNVAPHEKCIRQVKDSVRDFEKQLRDVDAPTLIDFGCSTVTAEVMRSALRECGYV